MVMETSTTFLIQLVPTGDDIPHQWDAECICGPASVLYQGQLVLEHHWLKKREE
jgi:hypothetical protein